MSLGHAVGTVSATEHRAATESGAGMPAPAMERIGALDVLRGIALLGMFLVHFNDHAIDGDTATGLGALYHNIVVLFFEERFWTMFGILFGVGSAVQLRRAEARGGPFAPLYVRRLIALAGFGVISHAVFGYNVLLGYAAWGLPLLLVRKWPLRALVLALVVSASSFSLFYLGRAAYGISTRGEASYRADLVALGNRNRAFNVENRKAQSAPDYPTVFKARLRHMKWFYAQPFSFLPVNTLTMFLLGVIGLRVGLFDRPEDHRRLIAGLIAFGIASWATEHWIWYSSRPPSEGILQLFLFQLAHCFGLIRGMWLAFAYIGVILLLVARNGVWLRRFGAFGWTGRMALTLYMLQIAILDLAFSNYGLHLQPTTLQALGAGIGLFLVNAALSRWWLSQFRYGPLEWLWRSITYGRLQELRQ